MSYDLKAFQSRYVLSNKDVAEICGCSLPTIQKWRSGEVSVSGAASQLMRLLDLNAEGNPGKLREVLARLSRSGESVPVMRDKDFEEIESSMTRVVDRLELMLEGRRKDKELAESEARYRSMVESSSNPVCRWRPDTTLTYVNQAYANLYGTFGDDLIGRKWLEFIPEGRRSALSAIISDLVRRGEEETLVHESVAKDGSVLYQEWKDTPVKNDRGELLEFHSIGYDITELMLLRKQVEELEKTKNALFKHAHQPVLIFNNNGDFLEMNEAFRSTILRGNEWTNFSDLMTGPVIGKFKRLLKRLSGTEELCYRIRLDDRTLLLNGSMLKRVNDTGQFLALFEVLSEHSESPVLNVRLQNEVILDGKSCDFLIDPVMAKTIEQKMETLGKTVQVDRLYVFTFDENEKVFDNILEWCGDGVPPHLDELQRIPMSEYPWWVQRIRKEQWIEIEDTSKLPRSAFREQEILMAQGICSLLVAPIIVNGTPLGFVGFDQTLNTRIWHGQEKRSLDRFREEIQAVLAQAIEG